MQSGVIDRLDVAPQQEREYTLPLELAGLEGELLLNVEYRLKRAEPALRGGRSASPGPSCRSPTGRSNR